MNLELVENIVALIGEFPVSEIEVTHEGQRVCVRRPLGSALSVSVAAGVPLPSIDSVLSAEGERLTEPEPVEAREAKTLMALMVGIFHQADPPLSYAADVRRGQVVGYIESMKLMNEVVAEEGGQVTDVLIEDAAPVEYGQGLFRLAALP